MSAATTMLPSAGERCTCPSCMGRTPEAVQRAALRQKVILLSCGHDDGVRQEKGRIVCHVCGREAR